MNLFDEYGESELKLIPVRNLGFTKNPWEFTRGAKTKREYTDGEQVVIRVNYQYVLKNGDREIDSYTETIDWLNPDGSVGLSKVVSEPMNIKNIKALNRMIRQGRIDYLEAGAEDLRDLAETLPEPHKTQYNQVADSIDYIFSFYEAQIAHYIQRGTMEFENAVNNETDATMLAIFSIPVRQPDDLFPNGLTVKQSIIHQLTGVKP